MPDTSPILNLPYILPAQAQKHVTHNEAIRLLDIIVQLAVASRSLTLPPAVPAVGERYIVAAGATGVWAGKDAQIAVWSETGWVYVMPLAGWRAHVTAEAGEVTFDGTAWNAAGLPAQVPLLGLNAAASATNRLTVAGAATLLTHDGAGHQVKVNKAAPADTASLLFQTGFSGRAEMGLAGNDDFSVKVSADGTGFSTALLADAATGTVTLPQPLRLGGQAVDPVGPVNGTLWLNTATGEVKLQTAGATVVVGAGGGGGVVDGDKGDVSVSGSGATWTIDAGAVSLAKLADLEADRLMGRVAAGSGVPQALTAVQVRGLLNVGDGAQANVPANLSYDAASRVIASDTGTDATLPLVTATDAGLAPASGGGTVNFLRADGSWAAPAGGGGGAPGGTSGQVQFNNAGVLGGSGNLAISSDGNAALLSNAAKPTAPAADSLALYARRRVGVDWPELQRPNDQVFPVGPHMGLNKIGWWAPSSAATVVVSGLTRTATGTTTTPALAATNLLTSVRRWRVTSAATANQTADERSSITVCWRGNAPGLGGFTYTNRIALVTLQTGAKGFFGLWGGTGAASTTQVPSALTDVVAFGFNTVSDVNWKLLHNDASGVATEVDLGAAFPVSNFVNLYTIMMYCPPNAASIWVRMVNETTGVIFEQEITTNLPTATSFLSPRNYLNNGGAAAAVAFDCAGVYLETDY
jgi:Protein of unknown function (DUF2793)